MPLIREYRPEDIPALEECIVVLQEHERMMEPNRREGTAIAQEYVAKIMRHCTEQHGAIFVAEEVGKVVGFFSVWIEHKPGELISTLIAYAYISDLILLPAFRGKGLGTLLLATAEKHAAHCGMQTVIINTLARNAGAISLYKNVGFEEYELLLKKEVSLHGSPSPSLLSDA